MPLSTAWVVVIIVVALAAIAGTITALKKNNKPFIFPEGYENPDPYDKPDNTANKDKKKDPFDDDTSGLL